MGLVNRHTISLAEQHQKNLAPLQLVLELLPDPALDVEQRELPTLLEHLHLLLLVEAQLIEVLHLLSPLQHPHLDPIDYLDDVELQRQFAEDEPLAALLLARVVGEGSQHAYALLAALGHFGFPLLGALMPSEFGLVLVLPLQFTLLSPVPLVLQTLDLLGLQHIHLGDPLNLPLLVPDLLLQICNPVPQLVLLITGLSGSLVFEHLAALQLYSEEVDLQLLLPVVELLLLLLQFSLLPLQPLLLGLVLLCLGVFFVAFGHALAGVLLLIFDVVYALNAGVYELDEFHFQLESSAIFDLLVEILYFLAEVVRALPELCWLLLVH